jgi:hypothetical protein
MMFFLLVGNRFKTKSAGMTAEVVTCPSCGVHTRFERKRGRQYLTLFFIVPVLPLGGTKELVECPNCHAQFHTIDEQAHAA